jgi:hypothetical protein
MARAQGRRPGRSDLAIDYDDDGSLAGKEEEGYHLNTHRFVEGECIDPRPGGRAGPLQGRRRAAGLTG